MKAVIMAGGAGTRLRPLTCEKPKPLAKIAGKSCILYVLDLLKANGITEVCVTLMYLGEKIKAELADVKDMKISYMTENEPLGTAGSVRNCREFLGGGDFLVISGDCVCDFDLKKAVAYHEAKKSVATILLTRVSDPLEYGVAVTAADGSISRFVEKPSWSRAYSDTVNTGIYIFSDKVFDFFPDGACDFSKDVFPRIMNAGEKIYAFSASGYWCDVGNISAYIKCGCDVLSGAVSVPRVLDAMKPERVKIPENCTVREPSFIGKNVYLDNAVIGPYAVICDGCSVTGASVENAVICDGSSVMPGASVRGSVICENVKIAEGASVGEMSVIGAGTVIGEKSVIGAGAKIMPENIVPDFTFVRSGVFGKFRGLSPDDDGFSGIIGSDLDLSVFIRAGAGAADILKKDIAVAVGGGQRLTSPMLAVCSGIIARGSNIFELGRCDINMFRFAVRHFGFGGGIYLSEDGKKITLTFVESDGLCFRRDYERRLSQTLSSGELIFAENGRLRPFRGYDSVYIRKLRSLLHNVSPRCAVSGVKYFTEAVPKAESPSEFMYVTPESLVIQNAVHEAYDDDAVRCVSAFCLGKLSGSVAVPFDYPACITETARKNGFSLIRTTLEDENRALLFTVSDPCIRAAAILRYMTETKRTFADILSSLPRFSSRRREVKAAGDTAAVMRALSSQKGCELSEGIRLSDKRGAVLIVPQKNAGSFRVFAEAADAETAAEICDFYVKKLKSR